METLTVIKIIQFFENKLNNFKINESFEIFIQNLYILNPFKHQMIWNPFENVVQRNPMIKGK